MLQSGGTMSSKRTKRAAGPSRKSAGRTMVTLLSPDQVAMLSSVLRSKQAVAVNIEIMRAFVRLRQLLTAHEELADRIAALERADISILDAEFLQTFKDRPQENLRLKLLEKLIRNQIQLRRRRNVARARSFHELLEATLKRYHQRDHFDLLLPSIMAQAEELYRDWPLAA